jgi:putative membrane protein
MLNKFFMKKITWTMVLCVAMFIACDKDDDNDDDDVNKTDQEFTMKAAMANFAEIDAGQLAASKAQHEGVQDYGEQMVNDHGDAQADLKSIASDLHLNAPDSLDAEHMALKQQLMSMNGRAFDSLYIHSMVKDHQTALNLFRNEADHGENNRLVRYAKDKLPHLQEHYDRAVELAEDF